jgi:fibronectin-binding autotransporter adhesin
LAAGSNGVGTLTINGALSLAGTSLLDYQFGQSNIVGGPLNDLVSVGGNLTLDGTINVSVTSGGNFDAGLYRVISYGGTLTDNGLALGTMPPGSTASVQTSIAGQVNLVNSSGFTLNFWDGAVGPKSDGAVNGGDGVWQSSGGNDNWTEVSGSINAGYSDGAFAIFSAASGIVNVDNSLGAVIASGMQFASNGYVIQGDALTLTGSQSVIRIGDGTAAGLGFETTITSQLTGAAQLVKTDLGTLILSGTNSYTGGTRINAGVLRIASDANLGDAAGDLSFDGGTLNTVANISSNRNVALIGTGTLLTDGGTTLTLAGAISGAGSLTKAGAGTLVLGGSNSYAGATTVADGALFVNGDQSAATGLTSVNSGATLGGSGVIGGDVSVADGATLAAGNNGVGTLTINGGLTLGSASLLDYQFGQANTVGGPLNDLVQVGGDLVLDGTINVSVPVSGTFDAGIYRVFNYGGTLTDNGLTLGTLPVGSNVFVQTSIANQVNLVNTAGLTLNFWDGPTGPKNDGVIQGGSGIWRIGGGANDWADATGSINADYSQDSFAIFTGTAGVVTVDNGAGTVGASGLQFAVDGYMIVGDPLNLVGPQSIIRVGDGTAAGTAMTATIASAISGATDLVKTDLGTLVLSGTNSYVGTTSVNAGTLLINGDQSAATGLSSVGAGANMGGSGIIGGDVVVADGATLTPGSNGVGTLTINGNLSLDAGSILAMEFGEANAVGGALDDLINVGGNVVLDGTIDVAVPVGASFDPGIYRVANYGGTLTDNSLSLGIMPVGSAVTVQTSIAGQVNLINAGVLTLNFWDGAAGPKFDGLINGGDGVWQNSGGNNNWADQNGAFNGSYQDAGFAIFSASPGTVTIDNSLGAVRASGMQFASNGYLIQGDALTLTDPQSIVRVGDGTAAGAGMTATIGSAVTGATELVKTDLGTLVLTGTNSYTGGTAITGGTLSISSDANLGDIAGGLSIDGGTLKATANMTSARTVTLAGPSIVMTDAATTLTLSGMLSGTGTLHKTGAGTLMLTGDNSSYAGDTQIEGTLAVNGSLCGDINVLTGGRLQGIGTVCTTNNMGTVAPGNSIGTLTVAGDYTGNGGTLEIETELGADTSPTDRLVVTGNTAGATAVRVINVGGSGAQTVEGIKIVDVAGASNGSFTLNGDYVFQGRSAVIAGAYGYTLHQGGASTPTDGDWYLRSGLTDPVITDPAEPQPPAIPLYQPGVPVYEAYSQTLLALNGLPSLQQRVGNRQWAPGGLSDQGGIWGRLQGERRRANAKVTTSFTDTDIDTWKMQIGIDRTLDEGSNGNTLVGGLTALYGKADASVRSVFGNGGIKTDGYGLGATLTWYTPEGFYADGQAQFAWYDSDLKSSILGSLNRGNNGNGQAISLEAGKRASIGGKLSLTPQIQMVYSHVDFDRFADRFDAVVSASKSSSLETRWGLSLDHQNAWDSSSGSRRSHVYGVVNLSYEWLDGSVTDVSGTRLTNEDEHLWGELGLGGSITLNERLTLYGQVSGKSALSDFGDSYSLKGNVGLRLAFW